MKKLIATLLTITRAMALFSIFAFAETARSSGDFTYEVKGNGTAEITGYSGEQADIILPNMIDGYTITSIGDLAFYSEDSQSDAISVTIPDSVVSIGEKAFWNRNVRSINLPDGLESIGYGAFVGCDECQFRVSANHPYFAVVGGSLYNKAQKELLWPAEGATILDGIVSIGDYAFYGRQGGDDIIVIPSSVQSIGNYAFSEMSYPDMWYDEYLQIPASVTSIGIGAFENFEGSILISAGCQLRSIPDYAFKNIDSNSFSDVISPASILENAESIGEEAFSHTGFEIAVSNNVINLRALRNMGKNAFSSSSARCVGQQYNNYILSIPGSLACIPEGAFANFYIPNVDCEIFNIELQEGTERIEDNAFRSCCVGKLVDITFPSTLKYIGAGAFQDNSLTNVYLPANLEFIDPAAFDEDVTFTVEQGSYAERWADENARVYSINGEQSNLDWLDQ